MHEASLLTAKALAALFAGAALAFADKMAQAAQLPLPDLAQYGVLGAVCLLLLYAIKTLHQVNQATQEGWRKDKDRAEADRLRDRDTFYGKLEDLFAKNDESREKLGNKFDNLSESIKESCKKHGDAIENLERTVRNQNPPH
jgi:hypothetical protein